MEGAHEIHGLRFWNGDPTVRLLDADSETETLLLERCIPGTPLSVLPEPEQDVVIAGLLRRLWRVPKEPHPFRPLSVMVEHWTAETLAAADRWIDGGLVREGLGLFHELAQNSATSGVLLATDLHAGDVLKAEREPWLVIDPKPFIGDPAYDVTQHFLNCNRLRTDPLGLIRRMADLLELDGERIRLWMFARAAAECRPDWDDELSALARRLG